MELPCFSPCWALVEAQEEHLVLDGSSLAALSPAWANSRDWVMSVVCIHGVQALQV